MKTDLFAKMLASTLFLPLVASAQGTMVYDQQSSDESNGGVGLNVIQNAQPTGQSFTPSLAGIGFVRFHFFDMARNNGTGAVLYVNIRADSITGPVIDSTAPVALPDNFGSLNTGFVDFFFASTVQLQPGVKYFLQPIVQSGDQWGMFADSFGYPGGEEYSLGSSSISDYWFREGIIVPEPSAVVLLFAGAVVCFCAKRVRSAGSMRK
jgi:hypothetical protein